MGSAKVSCNSCDFTISGPFGLLVSDRHSIPNDLFKYTVWQKKRQSKNQSCFIQAVISSNYVEINQHFFFAVSCFEGTSNFVQR